MTADTGERILPLDGARVTIGRDEENWLCLPAPVVSRTHAEVIRLGDDFLLRDHGSTNGSYVNDVRISERLLVDGDVVRFGKAGPELRFRAFEQTAPLTGTPPSLSSTTQDLVASLSARLGAPGCKPAEESGLRCLLAEVYLRKGEHDAALATLAKYAHDAMLASLPLPARADVRRWLGSVYSVTKRYDEAVEYLEASVDLYVELGDQAGLAEAHAALGRALVGLDEMLAARDHLHRAMLVARRTDDKRVLAEVHLHLGRIDWKESDLEGARYNWTRAARFAEGTADELLKARVGLQQAFVVYAEGDLKGAVAAFQEAIEKIEEVGNVRILLKAYSSLSRALTRAGSWLATERLLEQRLELAREHGLAKAEAVALTDLAELRLLQGRHRAAAKVVEMAVQRHGKTVYARTQRILGRVLATYGRHSEAVVEFEKGLAAARAKGALEEQILTRLELALAHLAAGDVERASETVDDAESTTTLDPALGLIARVLFARGVIHAATGHLAEANRSLTQASSVFSNTGDPYRLALCQTELGLLRARMDRAESGRAHLEKAREAFASLGAAVELARVEQLLASAEFRGVKASMTRPLSLGARTGVTTLSGSGRLVGAERSRAGGAEAPEPSDAPYRVLLAVTDQRLADLLSRGLEVENFVVDRVEHGRAAFEAAIVEPPVYDMLVLDTLLEHRSGFDVCRDLRAREIEAPVVLLGSRRGLEDKIEALQAGADDYLFQRGMAFEELLAKMEALLR